MRNAVGLKSPGNQSENGSSSVCDHARSCVTRLSMSLNQLGRFLRLGHASFSQLVRWNGLRPGTSLSPSASARSSIFCDMLSWPLMPFCSSMSERPISSSSEFIRPNSWSATTTNGDCSCSSSGAAFSLSVISSKSAGTRPRSSSSVPRSDEPPPPPPPLLVPLRSRSTVLKMVSAVVVRYPISAFGWSPNMGGASLGSAVSMWFEYAR